MGNFFDFFFFEKSSKLIWNIAFSSMLWQLMTSAWWILRCSRTSILHIHLALMQSHTHSRHIYVCHPQWLHPILTRAIWCICRRCEATPLTTPHLPSDSSTHCGVGKLTKISKNKKYPRLSAWLEKIFYNYEKNCQWKKIYQTIQRVENNMNWRELMIKKL